MQESNEGALRHALLLPTFVSGLSFVDKMFQKCGIRHLWESKYTPKFEEAEKCFGEHCQETKVWPQYTP